MKRCENKGAAGQRMIQYSKKRKMERRSRRWNNRTEGSESKSGAVSEERWRGCEGTQQQVEMLRTEGMSGG